MYNFSKKISSLLIVLLILTLAIPNNVKAEAASIIDKSRLDQGIISINYKSKSLETNKVQIVKDEEAPFLQSIQLVNWNTKMAAVKKAKELTKKSKSDLDKVTTIYNYVINNITYDNAKAKNVKTDYIPIVDNVLDSSKGICYDYASLVAAMLRSVGVPTKLVMGYSKSDINIYHAWNQIYLADEDKWITIDTTYDASSESAKMLKDASKYLVSKIY